MKGNPMTNYINGKDKQLEMQRTRVAGAESSWP